MTTTESNTASRPTDPTSAVDHETGAGDSAHEPTTVLITGANRGLGLTTARRLGELGWRVLLGARDAGRGEAAAADLAATGLDVSAVAIDVTSQDSVLAAVEQVRGSHDHLDVLINNAGVLGAIGDPARTTAADFLAPYGVNVLGPVRVTQAFLPLLRAARHPRVVMVSSGLGSIAITSDPERMEHAIQALAYTSSKAALNMVTTQYARAIEQVQFNLVDPGYTATDMSPEGTQTVMEGTDAIVAAAQVRPGVTGTFTDRHGVVPW
ncbi:SDR family NAD(P)-dependent oxidoreductase [Occultella gossypii]|uniref:SDR family NAD(P)-dependent oxidoreductase n=1 Tax=Occultella gossypii TaxID=2800820 RepID=A0ABS7SF73_9MICO|nr:SDR family NAD(P)-dependent oxidoreductase [Occultella gossypii]MBZ2198370.1 SDR family NAD(P)-dependent oxidoreductase [Occultella gossypii]